MDQSMSDADVKSCRGTYFQTFAGLCWVIFRTPRSARANLDFTYLRQASAVASSSKHPMVMKVWVTATCGPTTSGFDSTSPKVPEPFAAGTTTLYAAEALRASEVVAANPAVRHACPAGEPIHANVLVPVGGLVRVVEERELLERVRAHQGCVAVRPQCTRLGVLLVHRLPCSGRSANL